VERLDLRRLTALCGDYSIHIAEKLEALPRGARLEVVVDSDKAQLLEDAAATIVEAGLARIVERKTTPRSHHVILERA